MTATGPADNEGIEMIEIDKDVPLPPAKGKRTKYPWRNMKVGDSFLLVDYVGRGRPTPPQDIRDKGWQFAQAKEDAGVRVWRIK